MNHGDAFWVPLIGWLVVGLCVATIVVIDMRDSRRTERRSFRTLLREQHGWFMVLFVLWMCVSPTSSDRRVFPLCFLVPGVDAAFLVATTALAIYALSQAFRSEWRWRQSLRISAILLFPALLGAMVVRDVLAYWSMAWVWIPAGIIAILAAPALTRLAYEETCTRGQAQPVDGESGGSRLWRPSGR